MFPLPSAEFGPNLLTCQMLGPDPYCFFTPGDSEDILTFRLASSTILSTFGTRIDR